MPGAGASNNCARGGAANGYRLLQAARRRSPQTRCAVPLQSGWHVVKLLHRDFTGFRIHNNVLAGAVEHIQAILDAGVKWLECLPA